MINPGEATAVATPSQVRDALIERSELALLDVREEAEFADGHPLFAASLSLNRLELEILDRAPRRATPVVLLDDGHGDRAAIARARLRALGYTDVAVLEGGFEAWRAAGYESFVDVNVPSKAFGELVEATCRTPFIEPEQLAGMLQRGEPVGVLDARRFEEYTTMSIPTATSVPGGELVYRAEAMIPDPATTIVVNCAGRTRSILGAQSLRNAGYENPIFALHNGTIGWQLAGFELEHGARTEFDPFGAATPRRARQARLLATTCGVTHGDSAFVSQAVAPDTTTYRFDVRSTSEYAQGHRAGFRHAPGGQLVQETDVFAPVRGATIVLDDAGGGVRADMTGSWLAQMGWRVIVLDTSPDEPLERGPWSPTLPAVPDASAITAAELESYAAQDVSVVDLAPSPKYRSGHLPGAWFALRSELGVRLSQLDHVPLVVLTSEDSTVARFAWSDLSEPVAARVRVLEGGTTAWAHAGRPLDRGDERWLSRPIDVYRRPYEGTDVAEDAMQAYIDWELGLVAQLQRDGTHHFNVLRVDGADT